MSTIKVDYKDLSGENPVSDYCRKLLEDGVDPKTKLEAYKNGKLNMTAKEIGEAAKWVSDGTRFVTYRKSHLKGLCEARQAPYSDLN